MTIIKEEPTKTEWWLEMIIKYSKTTIEGKPSYNLYAKNGGMRFYRQNICIQDLIDMSNKPFRKATDDYIYENDLFDAEGECSGGCMVFT